MYAIDHVSESTASGRSAFNGLACRHVPPEQTKEGIGANRIYAYGRLEDLRQVAEERRTSAESSYY
jgi:hypothetical protein